MDGALHIEDVSVGYNGTPALTGVTMAVPARRAGGRRGAQRRRQVHVLQGPRGPAAPARGARHGARPAARRRRPCGLRAAARADRLGLPRHRARLCAHGSLRPPGLAAPARGRRPRRGGALPGGAGHHRSRRARHRPALGRPAAAGVPGPRPGPGAAGAAAGRALHRRGRDHQTGTAGAAAPLARARHHGAGEHARHGDGLVAFRAGGAAGRAARGLRPAAPGVHRPPHRRRIRRSGVVHRRHGRDRPVLRRPRRRRATARRRPGRRAATALLPAAAGPGR